MVFKNKVTTKKYTLAYYSLEKNIVVLKDSEDTYYMNLDVFYKNYEYVWMKIG